MAQSWKVTKAFRGKDQNTGEPQTKVVSGHEVDVYLAQVEGQQYPGWLTVNKQPGTTLNPGDEIYGDIEAWPNGKAKFTRQSKPQGYTQPAQGSAPQQPSNGNLEAKIDHLTTLLENFLESKERAEVSSTSAEVILEDIEEGPVDLSEVPY